jgi:hypothetical protein
MAELSRRPDGHFFVHLSPADNTERAERILRGACLQINDRVIPLYHGQQAPPRTSELEKGNYQ